jgi:hypothetical protein
MVSNLGLEIRVEHVRPVSPVSAPLRTVKNELLTSIINTASVPHSDYKQFKKLKVKFMCACTQNC